MPRLSEQIKWEEKKTSFKILEEGVNKMKEDDVSRRYPVRAYDE